MSLLKLRRKINHYGKTNYVNIPPIMIEIMKAEGAKEVFVEDDLERGVVLIRFIKEEDQHGKSN